MTVTLATIKKSIVYIEQMMTKDSVGYKDKVKELKQIKKQLDKIVYDLFKSR